MSDQVKVNEHADEPVGGSSEVERRIDEALRTITRPWQPTAADHERLMDALNHTPQDEPPQ